MLGGCRLPSIELFVLVRKMIFSGLMERRRMARMVKMERMGRNYSLYFPYSPGLCYSYYSHIYLSSLTFYSLSTVSSYYYYSSYHYYYYYYYSSTTPFYLYSQKPTNNPNANKY